MEAAGTVPQVGVKLDDLAPHTHAPGPFLSVYLTTEGAVDNAISRSRQRWRTLRGQLEDQGAPRVVLDLVEPLVDEAHQNGAMLAVVADASQLLLVTHLDEPLDQDRASWSRLPDLVPVIRQRQSQLSSVLVWADRGGADLIADQPGHHRVEQTAGDDDPMRKVQPGGWSHRRFQQRAENDWAKTASDVAHQVAALSEAVHARLIVLGGDVKATHMIRDDLPRELALLTRMIQPGRASDGSEQGRDQEVRRLIAETVHEDQAAILEKFHEERGEHDRAAEGGEATVDALNRAAVEVLLVTDERHLNAWIGAHAVPVSLDGEPITGSGDIGLDEVPLVDAAVWAAIATSSSVRVISEEGPIADGIGAVLRWAT